jgi:aminobenzoyl-glutamate transport protein
VTDRIIEPRLGRYVAEEGAAIAAGEADAPLAPEQRRGLKRAGLVTLGVVLLWLFFLLGPGTPLIDQEAAPEGRLTPFYRSLVAGFFILFLAAGWAYGKAAGTIGDHRDVVKMMSGSMADLAYYLVLLALIVLFTASLNLFVGSASAKWALLAPVLVPMLMLLGISAEMTTAAYRVGDSTTNIITPLMVYFPLILVFCQRWQKDFGLGSLAATMLPYSIALLAVGVAMVVGWVALDLPLGPGAPVYAAPPTAAPAAAAPVG